MAKAIQKVESAGHEHAARFPMQGTVAVSDGVTMWAFRYSSQHQARTLVHAAGIITLQAMYPGAERLRVFGKHAHAVVSEPLNAGYREVGKSIGLRWLVPGSRTAPALRRVYRSPYEEVAPCAGLCSW